MSDLPTTADGARQRAILHRDRAMARRAELRAQIAQRQALAPRQHSMTRAPIDHLLDRALGDDTVWNSNAKDNQWWLVQATAFGATESVAVLKYIAGQTKQLIELQREFITVLKEIRDDIRAASADVHELKKSVESGS